MSGAKFPKALRFLFDPHRYKVARGGRGSGKSWSFARALLIQGAQKPLRVLCTREIQKSIKDSVHKLLRDQIEVLGLGHFYEVLETEIRGLNGTEFTFAGLQGHTVDSIKSYEGCDRVWVEEAHVVSKRSFDVLIPTIRKDGSEVWISFNPELETDDVYQRFVVSPPPDCVSVKVNYIDNPWFPKVLEAERLHCQATDPKGYEHIWEGNCKPAVEGAIYYDEIEAAQSGGRICNVPYDAMLKVHVVFDIGWNDAMSVSLVQRQASALNIIENIEESHKTLEWFSIELKKRGYNWGKVFLPHDGFSKNVQTGKSSAEIMAALGWEVVPREQIVEVSVEEGIRITRMSFPRMFFDKGKSSRLVECAKRYRRSINKATMEPGAPLHDEWSHGADNIRYIAINADAMTNEAWGGSIRYPRLNNQ